MKKILISTVLMTLILFLWSGLTQIFPWGVPSAQKVSTQTEVDTGSFDVPDLIEMPPYSLTTDEFDSIMSGKISTLSTDETFSWIISSPMKNYDPIKYFIWEIVTQLVVSVLLTFLLLQIHLLPIKKRLIVVGFTGLLTFIGVYGQMINWWALPLIYGLGVGFNLIVGWLLASIVSVKWILK